MQLVVTSAVIAQIETEARAAHPHECCGILLGEGEQVTAIQPAANIHPKPQTHFEIDPQTLVDVHRAARSGGPQVVGYYHSHPVGDPHPSATDRAMASGDGRIWAIVGRECITFWCDAEDGFQALSYEIAGA